MEMEQGAAGSARSGRLRAQLLEQPNEPPLPSGLHSLGLDSVHDGLIYIPSGYDGTRPSPLVVMLHGAGGSANQGLHPFLPMADRDSLILLAPQSRRDTWDLLRGGFGADVAYLDAALQQTLDRYRVDAARLAIEGFSDGASYALSLGLTNGDLFTHIIAFSPGFASPGAEQGSPSVFISHCVDDGVLPIQRTSRQVVPRLERMGYDVQYREFDGGHSVPGDIAQEALGWFLSS